MSIASQISRIAGNVSAALLKLASKGVIIPTGANSDDLADLIDEIPVYDEVTATPGIDKHGVDEYFNSGTSGDHDISLTPKYSNQDGHITAHTDEPGTTEYYKIKTASPSFSGGALFNKDAFASAINASISATTDASGIILQTSGKATRGAVVYATKADGWINRNAGDEAMAGGSETTWDGASYYINGVTIVPPASGTHSFTITLPNGDNDTITLTVTVYANGSWSIE